MAVTIQKKMAQATQAQEQQQEQLQENAEVVGLVEKLATINLKIDALKPLEKEAGTIKKTLLEKIPKDHPETERYVFEGTDHVAEFSPHSKKRLIMDMVKAREIMGEDLFMKIASVSLTDVDKYLSDEEKVKFIVESDTGPRTCKVKEKLKN